MVVNDYNIHIDNYVTIVIIDDGLKGKEWKALEQNPEANVDIIGFVTKTSSGSIKYITNPDDSYLNQQLSWGHGFAVISALAAVARDVKVIFMDIDMGADPYGFEKGEYLMWWWIYTYQASKDIDIVSWSQSTDIHFAYPGSQTQQLWSLLINKGVIMLASAGNLGTYKNLNVTTEVEWKYPQYYTAWYAIGSIDHETRSGDNSNKNHRTYYSSWYESYTSGNHIVNWLEPGHGVPVLTDPKQVGSIFKGTWVYGNGTSISAPYLAAIIALIITGYHNGIGSSTDPSVQKVIEILLYASSRSTFYQLTGYGYVDAYIAYGKAYMEGRLAA
ncbi:MAG: S8/S53 family peptidase [Asgard group archaeon]|nr:S8/S53 family peptidase [Asgard group archaeon]